MDSSRKGITKIEAMVADDRTITWFMGIEEQYRSSFLLLYPFSFRLK